MATIVENITDTLDTVTQNVPTSEPAPVSTEHEVSDAVIRRRRMIRIFIGLAIIATVIILIRKKT